MPGLGIKVEKGLPSELLVKEIFNGQARVKGRLCGQSSPLTRNRLFPQEKCHLTSLKDDES